MNKGFFYRNIANFLTFVRVIMTFLSLYAIQRMHKSGFADFWFFLYIAYSIVVWVSDFFDGRIARNLKISSEFGAVFDVLADCIFVFVTHIQLILYQIIPVWTGAVMIEKILNYVITSKLMNQFQNQQFKFIPDLLGRFVAAFFYVTPLLACIVEKYTNKEMMIHTIVWSLVAFLGLISSVHRIFFCFNSVRGEGKRESNISASDNDI